MWSIYLELEFYAVFYYFSLVRSPRPREVYLLISTIALRYFEIFSYWLSHNLSSNTTNTKNESVPLWGMLQHHRGDSRWQYHGTGLGLGHLSAILPRNGTQRAHIFHPCPLSFVLSRYTSGCGVTDWWYTASILKMVHSLLLKSPL